MVGGGWSGCGSVVPRRLPALVGALTPATPFFLRVRGRLAGGLPAAGLTERSQSLCGWVDAWFGQ